MIADNCGLRLLADDDEGDDMSAVASLENVVKDAEAEWPSDSSSITRFSSPTTTVSARAAYNGLKRVLYNGERTSGM